MWHTQRVRKKGKSENLCFVLLCHSEKKKEGKRNIKSGITKKLNTLQNKIFHISMCKKKTWISTQRLRTLFDFFFPSFSLQIKISFRKFHIYFVNSIEEFSPEINRLFFL